MPDQRLATAIATGRISDRGGADGQQHQSFTLVSPTASEDGVEAEQGAELGSADGHTEDQTPAEAQSGESAVSLDTTPSRSLFLVVLVTWNELGLKCVAQMCAQGLSGIAAAACFP